MACRIAGVEPSYVEVNPDDPVAYVLSLNVHRRHLTPSQRALVAARARDIYDQQAKERQRLSEGRGKKGPVNLPDLSSDARDAAGKALGVSGKSVDFATKVLTKAEPEIIKAVDEGRMAVSTAAVYATEPPEVQREIASAPKRKRTYKSVTKPKAVEDHKPKEEVTDGPPKSRGVGITRAHEAIACLKRIPKNDGLRLRAFQIVSDWIKFNK